MKFPKYIKAANGQIGEYAYLTVGDRPVYRFEAGEYKFRAATTEELNTGSDNRRDLETEVKLGMQWKQLSSSVWEAEGRDGKFRIEHSKGKFWAVYASESAPIKFRPKDKLSEAKDFCERSTYWEDAV